MAVDLLEGNKALESDLDTLGQWAEATCMRVLPLAPNNPMQGYRLQEE